MLHNLKRAAANVTQTCGSLTFDKRSRVQGHVDSGGQALSLPEFKVLMSEVKSWHG